MKIKNIFILNASLILLLAACNPMNSTPVALPEPTQVVEAMPVDGVQYQFVTNRLLLPATKEQTQAFALNIDNDAKQDPDNKFGELLTLLRIVSPNLDIQSALDQAVSTGQLVSLHTVQTDDFMNDPGVTWSIFLGERTQAAPSFNGSDVFTPNSATPPNSPITGSLTNGHFTGGPGTTQVRMLLLNQQVDVSLIGVRLETDLSAQGCTNGKLGGGVTGDEFRLKLLPAIADGLNLLISSNEGGTANTILKAFDSDNDNIITTAELENNPLLMFAISPDLDLLDASGSFNPNQDKVKDSYSVGLGFTCVPAAFPAP